MKTAEEYVKEYYQLPKSKVRSVSITSLIKCLKRYEEQLNKPCVINSDQLHICKYCGVETTQPDEQCYKAEKKAAVCDHDWTAVGVWDGSIMEECDKCGIFRKQTDL